MNLVKLVSLGAALIYCGDGEPVVTFAREFENYLTGADEPATVKEEAKKPAGDPFERFGKATTTTGTSPWTYITNNMNMTPEDIEKYILAAFKKINPDKL